MIDKTAAMAIARTQIAALKSTHELVLQEEKTTEHRFGWIFFYTTREHLETGNRRYAAPGTAPLIVDRRDGRAWFTSTGKPLAFFIEAYERAHPFPESEDAPT
jgi:hypothetical protein